MAELSFVAEMIFIVNKCKIKNCLVLGKSDDSNTIQPSTSRASEVRGRLRAGSQVRGRQALKQLMGEGDKDKDTTADDMDLEVLHEYLNNIEGSKQAWAIPAKNQPNQMLAIIVFPKYIEMSEYVKVRGVFQVCKKVKLSKKAFGNLVKDEDEISSMFSMMGSPHMKVTSPIVKAIDQETMYKISLHGPQCLIVGRKQETDFNFVKILRDQWSSMCQSLDKIINCIFQF